MKVKPNPFPARLYELKKPLYDYAKKNKLSINDALVHLLRGALNANQS